MNFLALCVKEECPTVHTLDRSYGYSALREVKSLMQGCPCSGLCLVLTVQRDFQSVDREFQSDLLNLFGVLPPPVVTNVSVALPFHFFWVLLPPATLLDHKPSLVG